MKTLGPLLLAGVTLLAAPAAADTFLTDDIAAVQPAINFAGPGDTIVLLKGTYVVTTTIVIPAGKSGLIFEGQGKVLLDGAQLADGVPIVSVRSGDVALRNLSFRHAAPMVEFDSGGPLTGGLAEKLSFRGGVSTALTATCDGLRILNCDFRNFTAGAVEVTGDDVVIEKTSLTTGRGDGLRVIGDRAVLRRNDIRFVHGAGLFVLGADSLVENNRVQSTEANGVRLEGDGQVARGNVVSLARGSPALELVGGGGFLENNDVHQNQDDGIRVTGDGNTVSGNALKNCGSSSLADSCLDVAGNDNTVSDNQIAGGFRSCVTIDGDDNTLTGNTLSAASDNGILIAPGSDSTLLASNKILSNAGEGVENRGTDTRLTGNTILKNRRDVSNDILGGATITIDPSNVFLTGGAAEQADV